MAAKRALIWIIFALALSLAAPLQAKGDGELSGRFRDIPAFARKYKTSCSTCHAAAPKLNVLGEAFRLNGYRFPENDALLRKEEPVPLGAEPWKDLWPRAIWPGEIPSIPPISLRVVSDVQVTRDESLDYTWSYKFPHEIYALAGGTLGESVSFFIESEWTPDEGLEVLQAKVPFQNPLPFLPQRSLNLWVGLQNLYLFTLGDRQIDRAARQRFLWTEFAPSQLVPINPLTGDSLRSPNDLQLGSSQASIEANGILTRRIYYSLGISQGTADLAADNNTRKDLYYKLRFKLGGLALDGSYDAGGAPVLGTGGQLFDRSLIIEHFGYFGAFPVGGDLEDEYRSLGVAARWLNGPLDLGAGFVWGQNDNPWGLTPARRVSHSSVFAKGEFFFFPWLIGSLKFDTLDASVPDELGAAGFSRGTLDQTRLLPGVVTLIRHNVRGVIEVELFTRHAPAEEASQRRPSNVWFRLDIAF